MCVEIIAILFGKTTFLGASFSCEAILDPLVGEYQRTANLPTLKFIPEK